MRKVLRDVTRCLGSAEALGVRELRVWLLTLGASDRRRNTSLHGDRSLSWHCER